MSVKAPPGDDDTYESRAFRAAVQEPLTTLADQLKAQLPEGMGFALFLFDYGEQGNTAYISTAQRADMIKGIRSWLARQP